MKTIHVVVSNNWYYNDEYNDSQGLSEPLAGFENKAEAEAYARDRNRRVAALFGRDEMLSDYWPFNSPDDVSDEDIERLARAFDLKDEDGELESDAETVINAVDQACQDAHRAGTPLSDALLQAMGDALNDYTVLEIPYVPTGGSMPEVEAGRQDEEDEEDEEDQDEEDE